VLRTDPVRQVAFGGGRMAEKMGLMVVRKVDERTVASSELGAAGRSGE
jgi:hypothetical protein